MSSVFFLFSSKSTKEFSIFLLNQPFFLFRKKYVCFDGFWAGSLDQPGAENFIQNSTQSVEKSSDLERSFFY
jgi:hypothetical protein